MRAILLVFALAGLLLTAPMLRAQETPPGEEKKTEEELLKAKIVEIITKVKASYERDLPLDDWNRIRETAEKDLIGLGPKSIPLLLPYLDVKVLKPILGRIDADFAGQVKKVLLRLGWVSPEMKASLKALMEKLRKGDTVPQEDSPQFAELGDFAAKALDVEIRNPSTKKPIREKICEILGDMGNAGILLVVKPLLWAIKDVEAPVRVQALLALGNTARDDDNFKPLDKILLDTKAYQELLNHMAYDPDERARLRAATVLGRMEVKQAAAALFNAMETEKEENVSAEAVWALEMISGIDTEEGAKWDMVVKKLKTWWGKAKSKPDYARQLRPAKPAIRAKQKPTKDPKRGK